MKMEFDIHNDLNRHRMALVHGGSEFVLANRLHGFLIEPLAKVFGDVNILRISIGIDDELKAHGALEIRLSCLVSKFGLN